MAVLTQEHHLQRDTKPDLTFPLGPPAGKLPAVLNLLLLYLAAITIFGKGPTYIGIEPVYWGEIVLAISLFWAARRWNRVIFRTPSARVLTFLILFFIVVCAVEATMDFSTWGIYALRDSAVWYYSLFYFVGLAIASSYKESAIFASRWKLFWIISVPWGVAELALRLPSFGPESGNSWTRAHTLRFVERYHPVCGAWVSLAGKRLPNSGTLAGDDSPDSCGSRWPCDGGLFQRSWRTFSRACRVLRFRRHQHFSKFRPVAAPKLIRYSPDCYRRPRGCAVRGS